MRIRPALLAALVAAAPAAAQECDCYDDDYDYRERRPTGGYAGGARAIASARGEFDRYVGGAVGGDLHYVHRLDRDGWLAVRIDGGLLVYGSETQRVPLSSTIGGRVLVDLTTSNNIAFVGIGPQIGVPDGRLRPYAHGHVGYSYIFTSSSVHGGWHHDPIAETTNYDDWTFSYGGGAGLFVPVRRGPSPVSLDLGVRYQNNGRASYLRPGDLVDNDDGTITVHPVRSDTDLLTLRVGVSIGIAR